MNYYRCNKCHKVIEAETSIDIKCGCHSSSFTEIEPINKLQGVNIMTDKAKEMVKNEVEAWMKEHGIKANAEWVTALVEKVSSVSGKKVGGGIKITLTGSDLDSFNGLCRAIEQHLLKMDANTRAQVALILSDCNATLGVKFSDILIGKYNLDKVLNLSKTKEAQQRDKKRAERRLKLKEKKATEPKAEKPKAK